MVLSSCVAGLRWGQGVTALMAAAGAGQLDVVSFLVTKAGADPHAEDQQGRCAMDLALAASHEPVVCYLRSVSPVPGLVQVGQ